MTMTFCNPAAQILELAKQSKPMERALEAARRQAAQASFWDDPTLLSGWGHNFVCPDCAAHMVYEAKRSSEYTCSHCGRRASGRLLDEAWVYYTRHHSAIALRDFALCFLVDGNASALEHIIRYVDFYAEHYDEFPVHGEYAGKGKIMGQSLDEAVWAINVLTALNICGRDAFLQERRKRWMERLFRPMAELLMPQAQHIHNIPLWLWSAVGAIAVFFEDDALLAHALDNPMGIREQVRQGYTADGLWYECSLGYHYYSNRALTHFLCFYNQPQDELFDSLRKAYEVPALLSSDGESLPAVNDGWYPLNVDKELEAILRASRLVDSPILAAQLGGIYVRHPDLFETADSLLFLSAVPTACDFPDRGMLKAFPSTSLAVLYQPLHVLLKCGVLTFSHMHDDCLAISIPPFSDDLGTPGYGHPLTNRYYRRSLAHNTFLMDGQSQPHRPVTGQAEAIENGIRGHADNIYDGVCCTRSLTANSKAVQDEMRIEANEPHTFDWVFRAAGRCILPEEGISAELPYDVLTDIRKHEHLSAFELTYESNGRILAVRIDPATLQEAEVYTARIPGNPADQLQTAVLLRIHGSQVTFRASYEIL